MKRRGLFAINEHFEEDFNEVLPSAAVFNSLLTEAVRPIYPFSHLAP